MPTKAKPEEFDPSLRDAHGIAAISLATAAIHSKDARTPLDPKDLRRGRSGFQAGHLTLHDDSSDGELIWMHPILIVAYEDLISNPVAGARRATEALYGEVLASNTGRPIDSALEGKIASILKRMPGWPKHIRQKSATAQSVFDEIRSAPMLDCPVAALKLILDTGSKLPFAIHGEIAARARQVFAWPDHSCTYGLSANAMDVMMAAASLLEPTLTPAPETATRNAATLTFAIHADDMTEDECRQVLMPEISAPLVSALAHMDNPAALDQEIHFWPKFERATEALRRRRYWSGLDTSQSIAILVRLAHEDTLSKHQALELYALASERLRESGVSESPDLDWVRRTEATVPRD